MVGAAMKHFAAMLAHNKLDKRLPTQRRTVDASGNRAGSLQCAARLFGRVPVCDSFTSLLPTTEAVVSERNQPVGQHGECVSASVADPPPNPEALMHLIVCLSKSSPVTDDRVCFTSRTPPR